MANTIAETSDTQRLTWKNSFPGVYKIRCLTTDRVYFGSSVDVPNRLNGHLWTLERGKHCNRFLQEDFNKYGVKDFEVNVIHVAQDIKEARKMEQWCIDFFFESFPSQIYNIAKRVEFYDGSERRKTVQLISPDGKLVTITGIKEFCRNNRLDRAAIFRVIHNPRLSYKGWKSPGTFTIKPRAKPLTDLKWKNSLGIIVMVSRSDLDTYCSENGYNRDSILALAYGRRHRYKDLWEINTELTEIEQNIQKPSIQKVPFGDWNKKVYYLKSPNGNIVTIRGIKAFCSEHGLHKSALYRVLSGQCKNHKGWSIARSLDGLV